MLEVVEIVEDVLPDRLLLLTIPPPFISILCKTGPRCIRLWDLLVSVITESTLLLEYDVLKGEFGGQEVGEVGIGWSGSERRDSQTPSDSGVGEGDREHELVHCCKLCRERVSHRLGGEGKALFILSFFFCLSGDKRERRRNIEIGDKERDRVSGKDHREKDGDSVERELGTTTGVSSSSESKSLSSSLMLQILAVSFLCAMIGSL